MVNNSQTPVPDPAPPVPLNGWIILDKPHGLGSTQAVSAVKRALRDGGYAPTKKDMPKVGHGGTLDPLATGVLPIALGEATKLAGRMLDSDKVYDFAVHFGQETDTLDLEGAVVAASDYRPTPEEIEAVLPRFTGPIEQVPPAYSAIVIDGQRAYDRARAGEDVAMKPRAVTIHSLSLLSYHGQCATLCAHVSKGTYIRSLARDIALALRTVGHVTMLRRVRAGPFGLNRAISLDKLAEIAMGRTLEHSVLPLEAGLVGIPALPLAPGEARLIRHGGTLSGQSVDDGQYLAMDGTVPVALVIVHAGTLAVERGFNL